MNKKDMRTRITTVLIDEFGVHNLEAVEKLLEILQQVDRESRINGMKQAKSRVLRRTEIPSDAREPTRDAIVILGEEIADIIQRDIAALNQKGK